MVCSLSVDRYATKALSSPQLNNTRPVVMYLPPSYYENPFKPYNNTLVMHDGQNLFDPNTAFMGQAWMCQDTLDPMIVEGLIEEVVIVGVWNTDNRINEYTYSFDPTEGQGGQGNLYLDFLEQTVYPFVAAKYPRLSFAQGSLGILGSSLGGLISCYAGFTRPHVYSTTGCMSSSFWWNSEDFLHSVIPATPRTYSLPYFSFYLDSGNMPAPNGDDQNQTVAVTSALAKLPLFVFNSTLFYYLDDGGEHNEHYWGARFHVPMGDLYPAIGT